ncbi:MAG: hypothetical protein ACLFN8_04995 [Candidatus Woesearchaeota archaeon]
MVRRKKNKQTTSIVSLKIPITLYSLLEKKSKEEHYLDVSETVKSIIRKKYMQTNNPDAKINQLKQDIMKKLESKVNSDVQEKVIYELLNIKKILEGGDDK